jgi:hypothetical protein
MPPMDPMVPLLISVQSRWDELDCDAIIPISSDSLDPGQAAPHAGYIGERCRVMVSDMRPRFDNLLSW